MPAKVRTLIDVHEQNAPGRFQDYDWQVVRPQLDPAITITETLLSQKAAIDADPHLTAKGKDAARVKAAKEALEALGKWDVTAGRTRRGPRNAARSVGADR